MAKKAKQNETAEEVRHYFVDESGDGTLFGRRGKLLLGSEHVRDHFILGMLDVKEPGKLAEEMNELRQSLLSDPYFKDVPSMQPSAGKTATCFHAKDDPAEVRREVFNLLRKQDVKFFAAVKTMQAVYKYVTSRNLTDPDYRYKPDELYALTVRILFKNLLHLSNTINVTFASRGKRNRSRILGEQLRFTRDRFLEEKENKADNNIHVCMKHSSESASLQAADYFLWALQRCYERGEDRYISYLWDRVSLVHDIDDDREARYGVYYSKRKPLMAASTVKWASD
jgi:hypothetical protein